MKRTLKSAVNTEYSRFQKSTTIRYIILDAVVTGGRSLASYRPCAATQCSSAAPPHSFPSCLALLCKGFSLGQHAVDASQLAVRAFLWNRSRASELHSSQNDPKLALSFSHLLKFLCIPLLFCCALLECLDICHHEVTSVAAAKQASIGSSDGALLFI